MCDFQDIGRQRSRRSRKRLLHIEADIGREENRRLIDPNAQHE